MKKNTRFLVIAIALLVVASMGTEAICSTRCETATRNAASAKKVFLLLVEAAENLGNKYNDCMHQNRDNPKSCATLGRRYQAARRKRKKPRRTYYTAEARAKAACGR